MLPMSEVSHEVTFRELPGSEWGRLSVEGVYPYTITGLPPDNGNWRILVAEQNGKIIGCTSVHSQVHWDPWWIATEAQGNPGIVRGLIRQGVEVLNHVGVDHAFCTIDDTHLITQDLAERLGFIKAPGALYLLNVSELKV